MVQNLTLQMSHMTHIIWGVIGKTTGMKHPVIYDNVTWRFWRYKMDISRCSIRTVTRGQKRSKFDIVACLLHYSDNQKWLSYGKIKTSDRNAKRLFSNDHQFSSWKFDDVIMTSPDISRFSFDHSKTDNHFKNNHL